MSILARQLSLPSGAFGRVVGEMLARRNAPFNRWCVSEIATDIHSPSSVVELGSGPGVGLQALLVAYPNAHVYGVDPSGALQSQARRRNSKAVDAGRLTLLRGDIGAAAGLAPIDLIAAVHVLYFWRQPGEELRRVHQLLASQGRVALGYQLKRNMPESAQRNFLKEGFRLYESDDEVAEVLVDAGFRPEQVRVFGDFAQPLGRLMLAAGSLPA